MLSAPLHINFLYEEIYAIWATFIAQEWSAEQAPIK